MSLTTVFLKLDEIWKKGKNPFKSHSTTKATHSYSCRAPSRRKPRSLTNLSPRSKSSTKQHRRLTK